MLWNALTLALREIRRNVLRSFLTILGIVIGVAAVITLVNIGQGATAKVTADIAKLGNNLLIVRTGQHHGPGGSSVESRPFAAADVKAIATEISGLAAVAPTAGKAVTAIYGNANWATSVLGADNEYFVVKGWDVVKGRQFSDGELHSGKAVCILGSTVAKELFGEEEPLGRKVRLKKISCTVIGVLTSKGETSFGSDQDDTIIIPLRTFQRRLAGSLDISMIMISARDNISTDKVKQDVEVLMRQRRQKAGDEMDDFNVRDLKEIATTLTNTTRVLTTLLGAVAAVSLLVGGIGIMNIMLVSVTERTREIGTRLAIGALEREVLWQFLVEAMVLSSFGGLIGIITAISGSLVLSDVLEVPFILNMRIIVIAFLFSAAVGILFGYVPARKAARLDPIEALRHE